MRCRLPPLAAGFMTREDLPTTMRRRVREYFHKSKHLRLAETQRVLLDTMPPNLKREVVGQVNSGWLQSIWFLRGAPQVRLPSSLSLSS